MATFSQRLAKLLNIHPGESHPVFLAFLLYFFLCLPFAFTYSASYALFIDEFGTAGLPYYYIAIAIAIPLLTVLLIRLSSQLSQAGYLRLLVLSLIAGTFLLWLALTMTHQRAVIFSLVIWKDVHFVFMTVAFWNVANSLFDVRQGKRLFPLLGVAYSMADIFAGMLIPIIVARLGTPNLLLFAALGLGVALLVQSRVFRLAQLNTTERTQAERSDRKPRLGKALRDPYLILLFSIVFIYWMAYYTTNTIFYDRAGLSFPDADSLATFLGRYTLLVGFLALVLDTFVTGRFIERFGMRNGLLSLPVIQAVIGMGMLGALLLGAPAILLFALSVMLMLASDSLGGLSDSSLVLLYQPLPANLRPRLQSIADGVVACLATGLAGIMLIALERSLGINTLVLTLLLLPIFVVWIILIFPLMRQYLAWLSRALARRRLGSGDLLAVDAAGLAILKRQLQSPYPEAVIYAANRIEEAEPSVLESLVGSLLSHPNEFVRQDVLGRIERLRIESALPLVRLRLETDSSPQVRGEAARVMLFLSPPSADQDLALSLLQDALLDVQRQVLIGLLERGCPADLRLACHRLGEYIVSSEVDCRLLAAQVIGQAHWPGLARLLISLFDDPAISVRRAALHAASRLSHPKLWPLVARALDEPGLRVTAGQAIAYGLRQKDPALLDYVEKQFGGDKRRSTPGGMNERFFAACSSSDNPRLVPMLWLYSDDPQPSRQTQALAGLVACQAQATDDRRQQLRLQIEADIDKAAWLLECMHEFGSTVELRTLVNSLDEQLRKIMDRVLLRLVLHTPDPQVAKRLSQARGALVYSSRNLHAFAVDLLDASIPRDLKAALLPLWDDIPLKVRLDRISALYPQVQQTIPARLSEIITDDRDRVEPSTQAWAIYAAVQQSLLECRPAIDQARSSAIALVQETASWAHERLHLDQIDLHVVQSSRSQAEERKMLSTIEKMLILKTASIFAYISDEVVADIAGIVEEVDMPGGSTVISKGEIGDCMYIIVSGKVRIHDGERTLNFLGERQEFGEIALLDREPRSASVTCVEDTLLLRLDQEPFYDLMDEHSDFSRGVIRALIDKLRKT